MRVGVRRCRYSRSADTTSSPRRTNSTTRHLITQRPASRRTYVTEHRRHPISYNHNCTLSCAVTTHLCNFCVVHVPRSVDVFDEDEDDQGGDGAAPRVVAGKADRHPGYTEQSVTVEQLRLLAARLVGRAVCVGWPYPREAVVYEVSCENGVARLLSRLAKRRGGGDGDAAVGDGDGDGGGAGGGSAEGERHTTSRAAFGAGL